MELPVIDFIRARIAEVDSEFETRPGSVYHEMFIKPQMLMLQPLNNTMDQLLVSQSIRRILAEPDPDAYSESDVDDLVANLYVTRDTGDYAKGTIRVYYSTPLDKEFPALTAEFTSQSYSFFNTEDIKITAAEMALQTEGTYYYFDVAARAQSQGTSYNADPGTITSFVNDADAIRVTNISAFVGGLAKEKNTELLKRAQSSIGVRDLETVKGINAIIGEKFPSIRKVSVIGFGDPEMQRDVVYNVHVGGKTDMYLKTPTLTTATQDFTGMDYDTSRGVARQLHIQMAKSVSDAILPSFTGTPQIVVGSVKVREDITETSATVDSIAIPTGTGVNLVGKEWIKLQIDDLSPVMIKIAGATPSQTQRFEIINSINATIGYTVASIAPGNKIRVSSLKVGAGSQVIFMATAPANQGAGYIFNITSFPNTTIGVAAERYDIDRNFHVDYADGNIYQATYDNTTLNPCIMCGQKIVDAADGTIGFSSGYVFQSQYPSQFYSDHPAVKVRVGDELTITSIGGMNFGTVIGDLPQTFYVAEVIDGNNLRLVDFNPTATTSSGEVTYSIKSNQVVVVDYEFNPISIDVGGNVLLSDGYLRGVRPGRSQFTIQNAPFIDIVSLQEIDPESGELLGEPLNPPRGFGYGGFGEGSYGVGAGGDYDFKILDPRNRFSVFDDAIIILGEYALSKSYRVTYRWAPDIVSIHQIARNDAERVTGADVLPRHFIPAFVDIEIGIRRDSTSLTTPSNTELETIVSEFVNGKSGLDGIQASDISKKLEDLGVDSVQTPFTMTATVLNPDGTTTIIESTDILSYPTVTLDRDTDNYTTKRIVHFLPGTISVVEV